MCSPSVKGLSILRRQAKLLLFYAVFYAALAGFCGGLFAIFWQTIDLQQPKLQLYESFIGANPAMGFRPMPPDAASGGTFIRYRSRQPETMSYWYDTVNDFLEGYMNPKNVENVDETCSYDRPASKDKFCPFKLESLGNCSPEMTDKEYGFPQKKPCVFLKLNKIFDWTPQVFNESNIDRLGMPESLSNKITNTSDARERNMIWVSCEGESPLDIENIGPVQYSTGHGFPAYYFPYKNVKGYQPPIVAVKFDQPRLGVLISIECRVWAKNIFYDANNGRGSIKFRLMIDD